MVKIRINDAQRCRGDYSLFVSFDFSMEIVDTLKSYPVRYYNPDTKEWELPLKDLNYLQSDLKAHSTTIVDERTNTQDDEKSCSVLKYSNRRDIGEVLNEFKFKTKPFNHQLDGIVYGLEHCSWLLGDEQGLGKTKQAIDLAIINKAQFGYEHCLIICGVNGLKWNWKQEISIHSNEVGYIIGQRTNKNGKVVIKSSKEKLEDLNKIDTLPYFIITNVESLRNKDILDKIVKYCKNGKIAMCVADECHKMKNPTSQQGKAFLKINCHYKLALTGTPLMNTPLDLYIILKWLGYEDHAFYAFKNHYCIMGGFGGYEIVGYKNLKEIQDKLNSMMLRRLKQDVLDLPEKLFIDEYVEMTPKQEVIYKEVYNQIKANIDQITISPNPLANLIRLRQATGFTGILSSTIQESAKLDRMEELVADAVSNGRKVVIFSNWTQMTDVVVKRLKKYKGVVITGETNDAQRMLNVNEFQNNPNCQYVVGTIGALGTGLTLTAGTVEIFLDEPWNIALLDQAVDRCHRVGTKENVTIYILMCKNTIDERVHDIVNNKGAMSDVIVDGKITGDRKALLNFLLN